MIHFVAACAFFDMSYVLSACRPQAACVLNDSCSCALRSVGGPCVLGMGFGLEIDIDITVVHGGLCVMRDAGDGKCIWLGWVGWGRVG